MAIMVFKMFTKVIICPILLLTAVALIRTFLVHRPPPPLSCNPQDDDHISEEKRNLSEHLSQAIQFETVTTDIHNYNSEELGRFGDHLKKIFPAIHSSSFITREVINNISLLYTVKGNDSSLKPYLLSGHLDVVPVDETQWMVFPFGGIKKDGFVYGRGTIDAKHIVMGILEALEYLLEKGFRPTRSFYLAFGHDEEASGFDGASHISALLQARNVTLEYLLDEGMMVINNTIPGLNVPVAMVGVTEKGYATLKVSLSGQPGHSSLPPKETTIVILAKSISRYLRASFPFKFVYANIWLFRPILSWIFSLQPHSNSLVRTTTAVTMISGGIKSNVVPGEASAIVNHRVHPADSIEEVIDHDRYLLNNDNLEIEIIESTPPHPISPFSSDSFGYQTLKYSIRQIYPDCAVVPTIMVANTDSKWYLPLTKAIYRFSPVNIRTEDTARLHGNNERISIKNYEQVVNFYYHLIINSNGNKLAFQQHTHQEL
ncbi:N-fatty-acyl-amino acid synthase/hydrolase PM20D1-like [Centruroides sculpturatus]|uniref:N-fatty-acyl-amino acid synthase/hydrolase PM20D1-like n=1 Tax=Centruroides sculpturatus TaxID=218467 RepID=UPI000C6E8689|nr:N-fatty-acyl-amino acid synthase/hydrolase PM20D1-like [Centruroides sculpturatus]